MKKILTILFFLSLFTSSSFSQTLEWVKKMVSSPNNSPSTLSSMQASFQKIQLDNQNNIVMIGLITGTIDFDLGSGVKTLTGTTQDYRFFMVKYSSAGNLLFLKSFGIAGNKVIPQGLTIDPNNNIIVTGSCYGIVDVDPSPAVSNIGTNSNYSSYLLKYDSSGNYVWAQTFSNDIDIQKIATDNQGKIITVGTYVGTQDFNPGAGVTNLTSPTSSNDLFLASYTSAGVLSWVKPVADSADSKNILDICIDNSNNIFIAGRFRGSMQFDPSNSQSLFDSPGRNIGFFAKYSSAGNYQMAKTFYSTVFSDITAIRCDSKGNIILSGPFWGTMDLDASANVFNVSETTGDFFIAKYNAAGNFKWGFNIGRLSSLSMNRHEVAANGSIYLYGDFLDKVDFDPTSSKKYLNSTFSSKRDLFLVSYDSLGALKICRKIGGNGIDYASEAKLGKSGELYLFGSFIGSKIDFDFGSGTTFLSNTSREDNFFAKYKLPVGSFKIGEEAIEETAATENIIEEILIQEKNGITLYPNPSFDLLNIEINNQSYAKNQIKIYDFLGREVSNLVEIQGSENRFQLNTSSLSRGTYFLMISNQHKTTFIKQ